MDIENVSRLGIFDLNLAVLPGERVPLHIFEPQYKQLIADCNEQDIPFCIPIREKNRSGNLACVVKVTSIDEMLKDGRMNITVEGVGLARALSGYENPSKIYTEINAEILKIYQNREASAGLRIKFDNYCAALEVTELFPMNLPLSIYEIANSIGLGNREKKRFLKARLLPHVQENILLNHINLSNAVMEQEDMVIDGLILN